MTPLDNFYLQKEEPHRSCLIALKEIILKYNKEISPAWKYGMPFFCYKQKMICYLWVHKKFKQPYIGIVQGKYFDNPMLLQEKRSKMKIMLFDPQKDLPIKMIKEILGKAIDLCNTNNIA
jgi:hypothetical protein